jgi:hypothetical protein
MEEEFNALQEEMKRSEVTSSTEPNTPDSLLYNDFSTSQAYYEFLDTLISPFISSLYQIHKENESIQFDKYSQLHRRWFSLKPFFITDGELYHMNLKSSLPKSIALRFAKPFLAFQYNTFEKIERELSQKLGYLCRNAGSSQEVKRNSVSVEKGVRKYEKSSKSNSFRFNDEEKIRDFFNLLRRYGYIIRDSDFRSFDQNFSGEHVRNKIQWADSRERLNYIIKLLKDQNVIEDYVRKKNDFIVSCFSDRNGQNFTTEQFAGIHDPKDRDIIEDRFAPLWDLDESV